MQIEDDQSDVLQHVADFSLRASAAHAGDFTALYKASSAASTGGNLCMYVNTNNDDLGPIREARTIFIYMQPCL